VAGRAVYSTYFELEVDDATHSHYDIPVGFVAVVRDMRFTVPDSRAFYVLRALTVVLDDTSEVIWTISGRYATPGTYTWTGHQVFAIVLAITTWTLPYSFRASGYLLSLP
jgi:hypothetical protein